MSRNDQLDGQMIYQVSQEEALRRSARQKGALQQQQQRPCQKYCWWSTYNRRYVCEYMCRK